MAARGSILKQEIANKILETFPGSFLYNNGKEIRINGTENGEVMQIKVVLTASKTMVEGGTGEIIDNNDKPVSMETSNMEQIPQEPTEEEKQRLATLLNHLGI